MDTKTLATIREQLDKERQQIQGKADQLQSQLSAMREDLNKINAAMDALDGKKGAVASTGSAKGKEKRKQKAPSANKATVLEHLMLELSGGKALQKEELQKKVEKRIVDAGYTRLGFSLRFKEALADSQLVESKGGIGLKKS